MGDDEAEIRSLLEQRARAIRDKDAEAAVRSYAEDAVNFDLAPPLAQRGKGATDPEQQRQWFATWQGPIGLRLSDTTVRVEGNTAFAFGFVHMTGKRTDGSHTDVWARSTVCLEKRGTGWKIVHRPHLVPDADGRERKGRHHPQARMTAGPPAEQTVSRRLKLNGGDNEGGELMPAIPLVVWLIGTPVVLGGGYLIYRVIVA